MSPKRNYLARPRPPDPPPSSRQPENILCITKSSHLIKIIDFGLARQYRESEQTRVMLGTPEFISPEIINYEPISPRSDMWSLGVICYIL